MAVITAILYDQRVSGELTFFDESTRDGQWIAVSLHFPSEIPLYEHMSLAIFEVYQHDLVYFRASSFIGIRCEHGIFAVGTELNALNASLMAVEEFSVTTGAGGQVQVKRPMRLRV